MRVQLNQQRLPMGGSNVTVTIQFVSHKKVSFNQGVKQAMLELQDMTAENQRKSAARKRRRMKNAEGKSRKK